MAGCQGVSSGGSSNDSQTGSLALASTTLSFGGIAPGTSETLTILAANPGPASLTVTGITISTKYFSLNGTSLPFTIAAGQITPINIVFAPDAVATFTATATLTSNGSNATTTLALSGSGIAQEQLSLSATSENFGSVATGTEQSRTVTLTNTGGTSVNISQAAVTGTGFQLSGIAAPLSLSPSQSTTLIATFAPQATGSAAGTLTIISDASNSTLTMPLTGTGISPGTGAPPSSSATAASSFGWQCGADSTDCAGGNGTVAWPNTPAQPGLLRLVDAGTNWSTIATDANVADYDWTGLDSWLDAIALHEPMDVSQVFIFVPCWDTSGVCVNPPASPNGTNTPPGDLTPSGSPSFNTFVTAFVQHCSPNNNCVSNLIKYYEMWNEWDLPTQNFWTGTPQQLYQMVAPAVAIIRQNVPNAVIMSPSATVGSTTYQQDIQTWLNLENTNGKISDWVAWHIYLTATTTTTNIPEVQWTKVGPNLIAAKNSVSGWTNAPWVNTETNFDGNNFAGSDPSFTCPSAQYSADDCTGQIVRWQLLHASAGASSLIWFKWYETIGSTPQFETAYYYMMQYIEGGNFTAPCSSTSDNSGNQIWSCPFIEANGRNALFLWVVTPVEGDTISYTLPAGYTDYKDMAGNTTAISGASINIGPIPAMLEH